MTQSDRPHTPIPSAADGGLVCAICLFVREVIAHEAVTVIEGYAVCDDHLAYVAQGEQFASILNAVRRIGSPHDPE